MAKAVVLVVGVIAAFVLLIVLIGGGEDDPSAGGVGDVAALYRTRCASCHGADGAGSGNGPQLSGGRMVELYPDVADQIEVVTTGRLSNGMPGFGEVLSDDEIEAVAEYTRSL